MPLSVSGKARSAWSPFVTTRSFYLRYYKFVGNCVQCDDGVQGKVINLLLLAAMVATWIGVNHFLCESLESVDVFLAYIQMANVIANFNVEWPAGLKMFVFRVARSVPPCWHQRMHRMDLRTTRCASLCSVLDFDVDIVNFGNIRSAVHMSPSESSLRTSALLCRMPGGARLPVGLLPAAIPATRHFHLLLCAGRPAVVPEQGWAGEEHPPSGCHSPWVAAHIQEADHPREA
jgi:hypothetical protein